MEKKEIELQADFCRDLMDRLCVSVHKSEKEYGMLKNHYRMQSDAKRIRRELKTLYDMLGAWN